MDLNSILNELKSERDRLGRAIAALLDEAKGAVRSVGKTQARRGRRGKGITPAGRRALSLAMKRRWAARRAKGGGASKASVTKRRGGLTAAGRRKLSEAMKRRWAERKKAAS